MTQYFRYSTTARTTVRLPDELMKRAKRKAAAKGRSLNALIEEGLRHVLEGDPQPLRRTLPPISSTKGGLVPGIDLNDAAALQERDDLESISRFPGLDWREPG